MKSKPDNLPDFKYPKMVKGTFKEPRDGTSTFLPNGLDNLAKIKKLVLDIRIAESGMRDASGQAQSGIVEHHLKKIDEATKQISQLLSEQILEGRIDELEKLPVIRQGLHIFEDDHDIILVKTVNERIEELQSQSNRKEL